MIVLPKGSYRSFTKWSVSVKLKDLSEKDCMMMLYSVFSCHIAMSRIEVQTSGSTAGLRSNPTSTGLRMKVIGGIP